MKLGASQSNVSLLSELSVAPAVPMPGSVPVSVTIPTPSPAADPVIPVSSLPTSAVNQIPAAVSPVACSLPAQLVLPDTAVLAELAGRLEAELTTLASPRAAEERWRLVVQQADTTPGPRSVSVARCYPYSNRAPDILPYDHNRVVLQYGKDDYVNASLVETPGRSREPFLVTQAPLARQVSQFWWLVWEQGVETLVCLASRTELGEAVYLPADRAAGPASHPPFTATLQSERACPGYTERVVRLENAAAGGTRALLALEVEPGQLGAAVAALELRAQQRRPARPVLVQCMDGGSRSAAFLAGLWSLAELGRSGTGGDWSGLEAGLAHLLASRRGMVREAATLRHVTADLLTFLQSVIQQRQGGPAPRDLARTHSRHPSVDFVDLTVSSLKQELQAITADPALKADMATPVLVTGSTAMSVLQPETAIPPTQQLNTAEVLILQAGSAADVLQSDPAVPASLPEQGDEAGPTSSPSLPCPAPTTSSNIPEDLSLLADISFEDKKPKKFTKEDFLAKTGMKVGVTVEAEADPLNQLDPLWSLK